MANSILGNKNIRMSSDDIEYFNRSFEASACNSQGDFVRKMMDKWNEPEQTIEPEIRTIEKTVEIERQLKPEEILFSLSPSQKYALLETVLSSETFAQEQNELIDALKPMNKPFFGGGNLFSPELQSLWVRNIVLIKAMTPDQREAAIKHNMSAFLINKFLYSLIDGRLDCSRVTPETLKAFIKKQIEDSKLKPVEEPEEGPEEEELIL